jgi:hypothetical protein
MKFAYCNYRGVAQNSKKSMILGHLQASKTNCKKFNSATKNGEVRSH